MAIGWYIVPYKRLVGQAIPTRYCAMDDYTQEIIYTYGGAWTETEVLGNRAIVKVRAPQQLLNIINDEPGFRRLPKDRLDDSLANLPTAVRTALRNEILDMGYTSQEVRDRFGDDLGAYTLRQVLRFMATRRLRHRYDSATDELILDGRVESCRTIESVDEEVTE